jgi:hypothetical protein
MTNPPSPSVTLAVDYLHCCHFVSNLCHGIKVIFLSPANVLEH